MSSAPRAFSSPGRPPRAAGTGLSGASKLPHGTPSTKRGCTPGAGRGRQRRQGEAAPTKLACPSVLCICKKHAHTQPQDDRGSATAGRPGISSFKACGRSSACQENVAPRTPTRREKDLSPRPPGGLAGHAGRGVRALQVAADADALSLTMGKPVVSQHVPQISK